MINQIQHIILQYSTQTFQPIISQYHTIFSVTTLWRIKVLYRREGYIKCGYYNYRPNSYAHPILYNGRDKVARLPKNYILPWYKMNSKFQLSNTNDKSNNEYYP